MSYHITRGPAIDDPPETYRAPGGETMPGSDVVTKRQVDGLIETAMTKAVERYSRSVVMGSEAAHLSRYMRENRITDVERGIAEFLKAKASGTAGDPAALEQADITTLFQYAARNGIDLSRPGVYDAELQRYAADKRAGKIERYRK